MKRLPIIAFSALVAVAVATGDAQAQAGGITKSGTGLKVGWSWPDSISTNYTGLFPTFASVTTTDVSDDSDTVYVNDFYTSISLEDVIDNDYELTLFAAPHLTGGAQVVITVEADQDGRAFTLAGNAVGYLSAGDTVQYVHLFYDTSNFLMCGSALAE